MIEYFLPFLAGLCVGAAAVFIVLRKMNLSGSAARQALTILATLYTSLADDRKLSDAERVALAEEVRKLIALLKNTTPETT